MIAHDRFSKWMPRTLAFLFCLTVSALPFRAQVQKPPAGQKTEQAAKPIRIGVGLVQTDVTVFDRENRFVDNLKPDQFELKVDGVEQPIAFFELVASGSPHDEEIWAKAEGKPVPEPTKPAATASDAGRTILFFVDDWHMSAEDVIRARAALASLVDKSMGVHDRAVIFAASGQLGFLQQLTDNKAVLHSALQKLNFQSPGVEDNTWPPMTEGQAVLIEQNDADVIAYFCLAMKGTGWDSAFSSKGGGGCSPQLIQAIHERADRLAELSAGIAERSLSALRDLVRSSAALPGRKVIFFLSDGFVLQPQRSDIGDRLKLLTDAAARVGIVIYSLDTRGLVVGLPEAKTKRAADSMGNLAHSGYSEVLAQQDALNALASDTGGRFLKNTNALDTALITALAEMSHYYLLGWHIDLESVQPGKYRSLQVAVKDRPDLKVRLRQGQVDLSQLVARNDDQAGTAMPSATAGGNELLEALQSPFVLKALPVHLNAGRLFQSDRGNILTISYLVDANAANLLAGSEKEGFKIDVMGVIANNNGKSVADFSERLSWAGDPTGQSRPGSDAFAHSRFVVLEPGVYQVRVAARDPRSGRAGSAWEWIDIPPSAPGKISMSSIFLQEQGMGTAAGLDLEALGKAQFSIRRSFQPQSQVQFLLNIYNSTKSGVQVQTKIYRGNQVVSQSPPKSLQAVPQNAGAGAIFFSSELPLQGLPPGAYTLEVTATGHSTNASDTQRVAFWIR
jgi:VWFA-related protein